MVNMMHLSPENLSAVFFDFDGVLVEAVDGKTKAFAALYAEHGPDIQGRVIAHHLAFGSVSRFDKIRHYETVFLGRETSEADVLTLADRFGRMVEDAVTTSAAVAGAATLLDRLAEEQTPMFVVSGTPEDELQRITARRGMTRYFREVRGSPQKKTVILRDLIDRYGVDPARSVMIGDSLGDYEAAAACGLSFIGRTPIGHDNPFPDGIPTTPDLSSLTRA